MRKWEYLTANVTKYGEHLTSTQSPNAEGEMQKDHSLGLDLFLRLAGEQGWEMVSFSPSLAGVNSDLMIFKREVAPEALEVTPQLTDPV